MAIAVIHVVVMVLIATFGLLNVIATVMFQLGDTRGLWISLASFLIPIFLGFYGIYLRFIATSDAGYTYIDDTEIIARQTSGSNSITRLSSSGLEKIDITINHSRERV
jgi:hypothetical protein